MSRSKKQKQTLDKKLQDAENTTSANNEELEAAATEKVDDTLPPEQALEATAEETIAEKPLDYDLDDPSPPESNDNGNQGESKEDTAPTEAPEETTEAAAPAPAKKGGKGVAALATFAFLMGGGALGGGWYLYQQLQETNARLNASATGWQTAVKKVETSTQSSAANLDSAIATLESTLGKQLADQSDNLAQQMAELSQKTTDDITAFQADFTSQMDQRLGIMQESIEKTQELATRDQRDWLLAEVEYLMRTSVQRVILAGDIDAAVAALKSADNRLFELGDIDYIDVRQAVADEIGILRGVVKPDVEGTVFTLTRMARRVDDLRVINVADRVLDAVQSESTEEVKDGLVSAIEKFVKIRKKDKPVKLEAAPSVAPEDIERAKPLHLKLQAAEIAALRRDQTSYDEHMQAALVYLEREYNLKDEKTVRFKEDLSKLADARLIPNVESLGSSLKLFLQTKANIEQ